MSIFRPVQLACPACGASTKFDAVHSLNADRRPDLRDAVIDGTFQRRDCESCGKAFRLDPEMVYLDVGRGQWIAAFPADRVGEWESVERNSARVFATSFGPDAGPDAQEIGAELKPRVVFGWAALREKLLVRDMALDDVTVELLKIAVMRGLGQVTLDDEIELRLVNKAEEGFVFCWIVAATEEVHETLVIPSDLYDEVTAAKEDWRPLRETLSAGPFVDVARLLIEAAEPNPA